MTEIDSRSPETEQEQVSDVKTPNTSQKISEYVVSWTWLIGGLAFLLIVSSALGGLYYYRSTHFSRDVLNVAQKMRSDADELQKNEEFAKSYRLKMDAANLLMDFNRKQPGNIHVLERLNEILEDLLASPIDQRSRRIRQSQLIDNCKQLIQAISSNKDSFKYRVRIMELEWDQENLSEAIDRAREVVRIGQEIGRENYDAWRYIVLAILQRLPTIGYQTQQAQLSQLALPPTMDELLDKVLRMRPDNIDIARAFAVFIVDVSNRPEYEQCASSELLALDREDRMKRAMSIIDDMVSRNPQTVRAYLVRFVFKTQFLKPGEELEDLDKDLQSVLKLAPDNAEGLVLAGLYALKQSLAARQNGQNELADKRKQDAENYLKRVVEKNPEYQLGYQRLGDFYDAEGRKSEAIQVWESGLERSLPLANPELVGRIVIALLEQKSFEKASEKIALLPRFVQEIRSSASPEYIRQVQDLTSLLTARLYASEGVEASLKANAAQIAGRQEEARRFFTLTQSRSAEATRILERQLGSFGKTSYDYILDSASIYTILIGDSLMLAGNIMSDQAKWDRAVFFYEAAMPFPRLLQEATFRAAVAYQHLNQDAQAVRLLAEAVDRDPENMMLRYLYTQSMFQQQIKLPNTTVEDLELLKEHLLYLSEHTDQLPNPWMIDLRLIRIDMEIESLGNDPEQILRAQRTAIRKIIALESKEFPAKEGEGTKMYSDDLNFLSEVAGVYSSLAQLADFDRVVTKMRELPNGGEAYFTARINDALNRNDQDGAIQFTEEALESELLTQEQKQRFAVALRNLKEDDLHSMDKVYAQLKSSYERNPDALKPQVFFLLANMALDRDDFEYAEVLEKRLEKIEGAPELGTMWRYLKARRLLMQSNPPFDQIRQLQQEIEQRRENWDLAYLLKATTEERFYFGRDIDPDARQTIIQAYEKAIRCGNMQSQVWNRLLSFYEEDGRTDAMQALRRDAAVRGVALEASAGQFPQPYQRMYGQVHEYLLDDPGNADVVARQCIALAEARGESTQLIFDLNMALGKLFLDADMNKSAQRHLRAVARRGGTFVYPLAVALAKDDQVDAGFTVLLEEIDRMPASMGTLIPSLLILLSQVQPSEEVFQKIDVLMTNIEKGERTVITGTVEASGGEQIIPIDDRRIRSLVVRFPEEGETPAADSIEVLLPEDIGVDSADKPDTTSLKNEETEDN